MPFSDCPIDPILLTERAPDGIFLVDSAGSIRLANEQASALFGYEVSELVGATVEMLVPQRLTAAHLAHREEYDRQPSLRPMGLGMALQARRKDGSEFPVEISLSPLHTPEGDYVMAAVRDISDRQRLEEERNLLSVELETERERQRIGMDLHDGIMQEVYAVGLSLELALEDLTKQPSEAQNAIESAIDELHGVIRNIRSYIFDLRPRQFSGDLNQALNELASEFGQNSQIMVTADIATGLPKLPNDQAVMFYHVAHEALSNIRKHAGASEVQIALSYEDDSLRLEVADNGSGFDPSADLPEKHRGLRNMAARARAVGAEFSIESKAGAGTKLRAVLSLG